MAILQGLISDLISRTDDSRIVKFNGLEIASY